MFLTSKRLWKRFAYGFLILIALAMIAYVGVCLWANRRLAPKLAALRAAGEPTSIAELAPAPVPAEEDGATYLAEIAPEVEAFSKDYGQFFKTPLGKSYDERAAGEQPSAEEIDAIRAILENYPTIEPALRQALQSPFYTSRLDYSLGFGSFLEALIENNIKLRMCARMLRWKVEVLLAEDKIEEAVQTGLFMMRLSRLQELEPAIVNGLMANAIRYNATDTTNLALRSGPINLDLRKSLDEQLANFDELEWFVRTLKTERAVNLSGAIDLFPHFPLTWQGTLFQADTLDFYEKFLPVAAEPWNLSVKKIPAIQQDTYSTPISNTLLGLLFPAMDAALVSANQNLALIRCLRVLNALQAYKETHGKEATEIADLDLPKSATIDPFDGKPLKLTGTNEGWVIYSVYKNGVDDGGAFDEQQDIGLGPSGLIP